MQHGGIKRAWVTVSGLGELERYGLWALLAAFVLAAGFLAREISNPRPGEFGRVQLASMSSRSTLLRASRDTLASEESSAAEDEESRPGEGLAAAQPAPAGAHFDFFEPPIRLPGQGRRAIPRPPHDQSKAGTVVVQKGDTLTGIAARELGSDQDWKRILAANPGLDPRRLRPGQTLRMPGRVLESAAATPPPTGGRTYRVRSRDTLESIARHFYGSGQRWKEILEANRERIASPEALRVGAEILIP